MIVKKIYSKLYNLLIIVIHYLSSRFIKIRERELNLNSSLHGLFLILAPHSDDEWVGCSTIIKNKNFDVIICNMDMNGGDTAEKHKLRYDEMRYMARKHQRKLVTIEGEEDCKIEKLRELINLVKPNYICVPSAVDWHEDHLQVMSYLKRALIKQSDNLFEILMYQVSVPIYKKELTHCLCMSRSEQVEKWRLFREVYKTQFWFPYKRFMCNEYIAGRYCNSYSAEVFSCKKIDEWIKYIENTNINQVELKCNFSNLFKIRSIIKRIHE